MRVLIRTIAAVTVELPEIAATVVGRIRPTEDVTLDEAEIASVGRVRIRPIAAVTSESAAIDGVKCLIRTTELETLEVDEIPATVSAR